VQTLEKLSLQQSLEGLAVTFALAKIMWKVGERKIIGFGV
jgi:hypothetical protein